MRLDPLSIPYRAIQGGLQFVIGIVVFGVAGSGSVGGAEGLAVFGLVVIAGIALALGWQVAYYRRFEYRLTEDTFDIDSGVLSRREREIPYGRIQNVDIAQNVIQRVLGIAEVRLETAGGGESEAQLRYVSREEAERLQEAISRKKRDETDESEDESAEATAPESTPLFEITPKELAVLGVVSMDPRLLSLLALPLSFAGPSVFADLLPASGSPLWIVLPLALVGVLVATAAVSGVLAIARYYDFRLTETDDEFRYERGLLQRYSGSIPKSKVQTLSLTENVLARRLGYASLAIETAGHVATNGGGGSQSAIPIAERDRVTDLVRRIEPIGELTFERPPKRARRRYAGRYAIALSIVVAVAYGVVSLTELSGPWWALLALAPLVPVAAHLKWRHRGYHVEAGHVVTRNGFWSREIAVVPAYRIQTVASSATVFQRRWDLSTVVIDTAGSNRLSGSNPMAVDIDAETADRLREQLADDLQTALRTDRARRAERRDFDAAT
jgi:putative membrane protein